MLLLQKMKSEEWNNFEKVKVVEGFGGRWWVC